MLCTFKLDHLHPFKPLLFRKFSDFFTFILGGQFLLPQRAKNGKRGFIKLKSECTRDGRSLLDELSSARLRFWRNSHRRCAWAQNQIWRPPFGPFGRFGRPRGLQSGHFLTFKNPVFWSNFLYLKPHRYVCYGFLVGF